MTEITDMPQLASILFGPDRDDAFAGCSTGRRCNRRSTSMAATSDS